MITDVLPTGSDAAVAPTPKFNVTDPIVSPFCNPVELKEVEPVSVPCVEPYTLLALLAVIVNEAGTTVNVPVA